MINNVDVYEFQGVYRFLSNMYRAWFYVGSTQYLTVEHWYQCNKTLDPFVRESIRKCRGGYSAKKLGNSPDIELRPDWDGIKLEVMYRGVFNKFDQNSFLRTLLLNTGSGILEEGNNWGDKFWGVCNGEGENHLGRILMRVREEKMNAS